MNTWRLNNMLLKTNKKTPKTKQNKKQWVNDEIYEEILKYLKINDNENTTIQNLWDEAKAVLRGKFTAIQVFLKKQEKFQINNLTYHLKNQKEKKQQNLKAVEGRK